MIEQILPTGDPRIPMVEYFKVLLTFTNINTHPILISSALSSSVQCGDAHFKYDCTLKMSFGTMSQRLILIAYGMIIR
ncbi:MAG: hypothetical protein IPN88_15190 [Bacteroidetes bacterium]|nr:hypothetical protein [Bacteroidota bacterium]